MFYLAGVYSFKLTHYLAKNHNLFGGKIAFESTPKFRAEEGDLLSQIRRGRVLRKVEIEVRIYSHSSVVDFKELHDIPHFLDSMKKKQQPGLQPAPLDSYI